MLALNAGRGKIAQLLKTTNKKEIIMQQFKLETVLATFPQLKSFGMFNMGFIDGELFSTSDYEWKDSGVTENDIAQAFADGKIELVKEESVKTTKLNNGTVVVAKDNGNAMQYANLKQASKKADELGLEVYQAPMSRVFYIKA